MNSSQASADAVFGAVRLDVLAAYGGAVAVTTGDHRAPVILDADSYLILQRTTRLQTLRRHALDCQTNVCPAKTLTEIERALGALVDQGLLRQVPGRLAPQTSDRESDQIAPISSIAVSTKDRPLSLARCLASICRNLSSNARCTEVRIYDDSPGDASRQVASLQQAHQPDLPLRYAGRREKESFLRALASHSGLPHDLLAFAFDDPMGWRGAYGANLNCMLADSAGERILSVDDDVVYRLARCGGQTGTLAFAPGFDPSSIRVYESRTEAAAAVCWDDIDVASVHEQLLGHSVAALISNRASDVEVAGATASCGVFSQPGDCTVAATMTGIAGDAGRADASWVHFAGPVQQQVLASEDSYRRLHNSSSVVRSSRRITIAEGQFFMTTMAGLDNRSVLPPFVPVLRNQDGIFGHLLRTCWPQRFIGHLPWVALHDPMPEYCVPRIAPARGLRFADLMIRVIGATSFRTCGSDPLQRLARVSTELTGIASLDEHSFGSWLRLEWARHLTEDLLWHRSLLRRGRHHIASWQRDMEIRVGGIEASLAAGDPVILDIPDGPGGVPAETRLRRLLFEYGRLLQYWPWLVSACRDLRASGIRMVQEAGSR